MSLLLKKIKVMLFALLVFSGSALFAQNQEDSDWYWGKTVSDISFEGLRSVKRSELSGITDSFIGKPFDEKFYNDILDRLYSLGYFEDIEPFAKQDKKYPDKINIVFTVKEHAVVASVSFKGNKKIRNNELRDTVSIKAGDIYIEQNALVDERALRDLYIKKGYADVKISTTTEETDAGIDVAFIVNEGNSTVVSSIKFSGNTVFSERTLKGKLSLKEKGFLKDGAYQDSSVEVDKQAIVIHYRTKGYIDARVVDVLKEESYNEKKEREEIALTFVISEGAQYTFSGLTISGNEIFTTEKLLSYVKIKVGEVFNETKFNEGLSGITNLYYENGYMSNGFVPSQDKNTEKRTIACNLVITERSRAHIENIIIKGNTKTKENVILRELPFEPGDVFSRDKIMSGLRNLYNTQYFSSVVPEPVSGSEENLVDLVITVEEQSTTSLQFGMTFSGIEDADDLPISLYAKVENSNFKGTGKSISSGVTIASNEQSVDFGFRENWLFNQPISFSESLSLYHTDSSALALRFLPNGVLDDDYYYMNYESYGASLSTSFGRRWLPNFAIFTLSGGMSNSLTDNLYDEALYVPIDSSVNKFANRFGIKNSLFMNASLDNRDINYDPTKGWFVSERLAWYGLIPEVEKEFYLRSDTKLESYLKLFDVPLFNGYWNFKMVLAAYTGISLVYPVPGTLFGDSSKVYIDGMFNGRGWTDVYNETRGKAMLSNRVELRLPLFQGILGLDGFFDAVAVKDEPEDLFNNLKLDDFYFSFGPGLRFLVPQFPLHLLFANKFRVVDGEVKWDDTWQFVLSFNMTNK